MDGIMKNVDKVILGFCFAICAFSLTVIMSTASGFVELNPLLGFLFVEYNTYYVILIYTFLWSAIFALYIYAEDKINVYQLNYIANIILLVGFFDLLHDLLMIGVYLKL